MALTLLTGKITHMQHATETSGSINANQGGQISTAHSWAFRVNNRPAVMKLREHASFSENDEVTAVGSDKNGTFKIMCIRNESTGALHKAPSMLCYIAGGLSILLGLPLSFIIIGLPLLGFGIYLVWLGKQYSDANTILLGALPRVTA